MEKLCFLASILTIKFSALAISKKFAAWKLRRQSSLPSFSGHPIDEYILTHSLPAEERLVDFNAFCGPAEYEIFRTVLDLTTVLVFLCACFGGEP